MTEAFHLRATVLPQDVLRDVYVTAGCISFEPVAGAVTVATSGYVLPGLVDAHAHLALASPAGDAAPASARVRASAAEHLESGVLAVREPGGPGRDSAGLGPAEGLPRIYSGGWFLAPPNGYFPGLAREVTDDELPDAAVAEAAASGAWAKVIGDWIDASGRPRANFSADALAEAVRRVHATGARFAVHAATPVGIEAAIEAGADTIEHGLGLRDDHIASMAERDIILVPTMLAMSTALPDTGGTLRGLGWNAAAVSDVMATIKPQADAVRRAWEAGVLVLAGTDAGMVPHGRVVDELRCLDGAGLPRIAVLGAGCWDARRFLGLPLIAEGAPADLVLYDADPRERLETLDKPLLRILDGRLVSGRVVGGGVAAR